MSNSKTTGEILCRTICDITVREVIGSPSAQQFIQAVEENYRDPTTKFIIWDFSNGSAAHLSVAEIQGLVGRLRPVAGLRTGGKTALVAPNDLEFGMGRMLEVYREIYEFPFELKVFREVTQALAWIGIDDVDLR